MSNYSVYFNPKRLFTIFRVKAVPKCKNCREKFEYRFNSFEKYCWNPDCKTIEAINKLEKLKKAEAKKQRKELRERKENLETIQQKIQKVQKVCNEYVRIRDKGKECISCDKILRGKFDAGHYFNANQHWNLRFNLNNISGQCVTCNRYRHGNLIPYREKLIQRIGMRRFLELEENAHVIRKFTKWELDQLLIEFKAMVKEIKTQVSNHKNKSYE